MEIFIKTLTGKTLTVCVGQDDTTQVLQEKIREQEGIPADQQRLIYNGRQMQDDDTLGYCNIQSQSTIHLVLRLRGMISSFSFIDTSDPLTAYLLAEEQTKEIEPSKEELDERVRSLLAAEKACYKLYYTGDKVLCNSQRKQLISFSDAYVQIIGSYQGSTFPVIDAKIVFKGENLHLLDELLGNGTVSKLMKLCQRSHAIMKIVLRRTEGPLDGCIAFHPDGPYATITTQFTLNGDDEYKGGRLCFYSPDVGLHIPARPSGTVTVHPREQLHGVTRLISGKRYSLLIVDDSNGLGDDGVFNVDKRMFDFLKPHNNA